MFLQYLVFSMILTVNCQLHHYSVIYLFILLCWQWQRHGMPWQYNTNKYLLKFKRCFNNKYFISFNYFMYCDDFGFETKT